MTNLYLWLFTYPQSYPQVIHKGAHMPTACAIIPSYKINELKMLFHANITLKVTEKNSFNNKETGELVTFYSAYVKDSDGAVLKLNCGKNDFSSSEGKTGVGTINAREVDGHIKLTLIDFREGEDIAF